jgi:hypothetical protein
MIKFRIQTTKEYPMLKRIGLFAILALLIASCSSEEETVEKRKIEDYVSAVMNGNNEVFAFGSVSLKGIMDKTDYKNEKMIEGLISGEIDNLNRVLSIDSPVHFTVEGPVSKEGKPKRVLLFVKVKNADELEKELKQRRSFLVEETNGIRYAEDDEFIIAFRNDLAIAIIQQGKYNTKKVVNEVFKKSRGKVSGGKIDEMIQAKGDFVSNVSIEGLYATSSTDLDLLSPEDQKKIQTMVKGSFVQSVLNFEKGGMSIDVKNYFSKEMQELMFFKSNKSSDLASKLARGDGRIVGGVSINLDVKKMEDFYATYAPNIMEKMNVQMEEMGGLFKYLGTGNLMSSVVNGEAGMIAIGKEVNGEFEIGSRSYLSTSEAGQKVFSLMRNEIKLDEGVKLNYADGGLEALAPYMGTSTAMLKSDAKLDMPKGSEKFGTTGFFMFIDFDAISSIDMGPLQSSVIGMLDYATIEMNNDGGKFFIKTKNNNDNILKQVTKEAMSMLPMLMGGGF